MRTAIIIAAVATLLSRPAFCAENFKDVPKDHWAADSVQIVKTDGVMNGYPDATFKGDKPVTRYELAAALERMIAFIQQGLKPEVESGKSKAQSQGASAQPPVPAAKPNTPLALSRPQDAAVSKGNPAQALKADGYIAANSPLLSNQQKKVTPAELAQALSSVAAKLVEKTIPPPKN